MHLGNKKRSKMADKRFFLNVFMTGSKEGNPKDINQHARDVVAPCESDSTSFFLQDSEKKKKIC